MSKKRNVRKRKVQPDANMRPAYYVAVTDVDGTPLWRGVLDDTNIRLSTDAAVQDAQVWIKASSLASYLKRKVAQR